MSKIIGTGLRLPEELQLPSASKDTDVQSRNDAMMTMERDTTIVVENNENAYIFIDHTWYSEYAMEELTDVRNCCIARISQNFNELDILDEQL